MEIKQREGMKELHRITEKLVGETDRFTYYDVYKPLKHTYNRLWLRYGETLEKLVSVLEKLRAKDYRLLIKMLRGREVVFVDDVVVIGIYKNSAEQFIPITVLAEDEEVLHQDGQLTA